MPPVTDRFSALPDATLCFILSKIPVKEAIRSSLLSKRWRFLYTQMPRLILSPYLLLGPVNRDPISIAKVENIISKILLLQSSDLEAFHLSNQIRPSTIQNSQWRFTRDSVYKWVRFAAWRNVQHLSLCDSPEREIPAPALFSCSRLIILRLRNYILSHLPIHFTGFNHLTTCTFKYVELTDHSLARFISHCPLLQNLTLFNCLGLQQPAISAPNITDLNVYRGVEVLTVNCPKLNTLYANLIKDLRVNGILFDELSCSISELNMQGGSNLIGLKMKSWKSWNSGYNFSADRFIEIIGSFKSLKELVICVRPLLKSEKEKDICLLNVFERLPHLEHLYIGDNFFLVSVRVLIVCQKMSYKAYTDVVLVKRLSSPVLHLCASYCGLKRVPTQELASYAIPPSLSSPLSNLRKIDVDIDKNEFSNRNIRVLDCFLQSTPALQMMEFHLLDEDDSDSLMYTEFLKKVIYLNRVSKQARILA